MWWRRGWRGSWRNSGMRKDRLPEDWREANLGQLGMIFRGNGGTRADEVLNGLPCIRYGDLYTHHNYIVRSFSSSISPSSTARYTRLQSGDVVFAGSGETFEDIGKAVAYCDEGVAFAGADTIIFRPGAVLVPEFAGYVVNSEAAISHKSRMGQGSSVIHIGAAQLSIMRIALPPVDQQRRIADILQTLGGVIEQTEALIAKTQQIKAGLMHDLFVRGVTADGQLRPPYEDAPELYKETRLGWVPVEWEVGGLADKGRIGTQWIRTGPFGSALKGEHWREHGHPVTTIGALGEGEFIASELLFVSTRDAARLIDFQLKAGDVVFSRVADVGRSVVVRNEHCDWIMSSNLMRIAVDANRVRPDFLQMALAGDARVKAQIRVQVNSGGRDVANSNVLSRLIFPWPDPEEQDRIVDRLSRVNEVLLSERQKLEKQCVLKLGLMHDLLTGRVALPVSATAMT